MVYTHWILIGRDSYITALQSSLQNSIFAFSNHTPVTHSSDLICSLEALGAGCKCQRAWVNFFFFFKEYFCSISVAILVIFQASSSYLYIDNSDFQYMNCKFTPTITMTFWYLFPLASQCFGTLFYIKNDNICNEVTISFHNIFFFPLILVV